MIGTFGLGANSALRFSPTRSRIQNGVVQPLAYPNPFFDIAHTYFPTTVKQLFRWCRYYFLTNSLINAIVFKLSEYPVTDIIIEHQSDEVRKLWTDFFQDHLNFRSFQVEFGLDYHVYGNGLASIGYPFKKFLTCTSCSFQSQASKIRNFWQMTNFAFRLSCPRCGHTGDAIVKDFHIRDQSGVKLIRWNAEDVEINYNDISGEYTHFYNLPHAIRNDIVIGKKDVVEQIPQIFIQSLKEQKGIIFQKQNLFHMRRATIATQDRGWGIPLLLPVLKDTFYLQIMKKANESLLLEHASPMRILFPQAGSGTADPYCLSSATLVEVNKGYKLAKDVVTGDLVKTAKGNYLPVTATKVRAIRPKEKVYKVTIAGMTAFPVTASEEHPFFVVKARGKYKGNVKEWTSRWMEVQDLKIGDYVAYPITREVKHGLQIDLAQYVSSYVATEKWIYQQVKTQENALAQEYVEAIGDNPVAHGQLLEQSKILGVPRTVLEGVRRARKLGREVKRTQRFIPWSKEFATILGYYLAEGCVDSDRVTYTFHEDEGWMCDELDEAFIKLFGIKGHRSAKKESKALSYRVNHSVFAEFLKAYGGHLAWNKKLPEESVHLPEEVLVELLRCMTNGDGGLEHVFRDNNQGRVCRTSAMTYTTTSPHLALKFRELLLYLGVVGKVHSIPVRKKRKHTIYRVKVNGAMYNRLCKKFEYGVEEALVKQDSSQCFIEGDYAYFRVKKIEEVKDVDVVYGFQVDGDKSFCVPACATHNTSISLVDWKEHVGAEIARMRMDPNYVGILPLPVGNQTIGGDAKALLLTPEMQAINDQIMIGLGVPREFVMGGVGYSGANISMRMVENAFIGYISRQRTMARWVMQEVSSFLDWPIATIRFKPFKMADDIQQKAYKFQLNSAGKLSDTSLLADADYNQEDENALMTKETESRVSASEKQQLAMAELQGKQQLIMAKYQVKAQQAAAEAQQAPAAPGEAGAPEQQQVSGTPGGQEAGESMPQVPQLSQSPNSMQNRMQQGSPGNMDISQMAYMQAQTIANLPDSQRQQALSNLYAQSPELADLVLQNLKSMGISLQAQQQPLIDARPLPEQRPPRRTTPSV